MRVFGFEANSHDADYGLSQRVGDQIDPENFLTCGGMPRPESLPGADIGRVRLDDRTEKDAGRKTMRGMWNAELHGPLLAAYEEGRRAEIRDVLVWKNKNSGLLYSDSACNLFLRENGIRTLLFAGVNTDQCVMASLQDAHARGYNTVMLKDACATDSPEYVQRAAEYNMCRDWGFLTSSKAFAGAAGV
jgi:nicotinamidase-related amidase